MEPAGTQQLLVGLDVRLILTPLGFVLKLQSVMWVSTVLAQHHRSNVLVSMAWLIRSVVVLRHAVHVLLDHILLQKMQLRAHCVQLGGKVTDKQVRPQQDHVPTALQAQEVLQVLRRARNVQQENSVQEDKPVNLVQLVK